METQTYKEEKEAFVSNCSGGSLLEIQFVASTVLASHCLWLSLVKSGACSADSFMVQFLVYIVPAVLFQTVLSDHIGVALFGLLLLSFNALRNSNKFAHLRQMDRQLRKQRESRPKTSVLPQGHNAHLSVYRASIMILTCIAILAVDFPVFPRRFAKVETFGTSLMDVGVGSFVFSSGLIASKSYGSLNAKSFAQKMKQACRTSGPLLALGISRLLVTRSVDYQLHNSEYGLHWNFFVTLGLLPPFVTCLMEFAKKPAYFLTIGMSIAALYQFALYHGLQNWVLNAPRTTLLSANKEGISSFPGYLAIFLIGADAGLILFQNRNRDRLKAIQLAVKSMLCWLILGVFRALASYYDEGYWVSRRLANLPYIAWVAAFNMILLSALIFIDEFFIEKDKPALLPQLLHCMNLNGLATFLLANVLTGSVNLSIKTLYAPTYASMLILCVYMLLVCAFPWFFWLQLGIRIKL
ncbi:GWT1-domain-containing protein [Gongronella butleri]|nr:GWT1-domain-containing protein [Gongronella butleri]